MTVGAITKYVQKISWNEPGPGSFTKFSLLGNV